MKKTLIILLISFISTFSFAQNIQFTIADEINYLLKDDFFRSTLAAVDIYNLTSREIIYRHNENMLLHPASNMKVLTTAAALYFLGPDYNFKTVIAHDGEIKDSVLMGNLYFIGGFDPDFTSQDLDSMIIQLREIGIKKINGNLYVDVSKMDSLFWGSGWMWDDDPSYNFPYMTPLVINDASVKVIYSPGNVGDKVNITLLPESKYFHYSNESLTVESDTADFIITRDWINRSDSIIIKGELDINSELDTVQINLTNPNKYFLTLARETLNKHQITVAGKCDTILVAEPVEELFSIERSFSDVIINLNKESDNLSAEMTLRALAYENQGKPASAENGIKLIDSLIIDVGLNPDDYRLVDGSGVSHYNLVTAELLNEVLKYFYIEHRDLYKILYDSFPVAGVDGTIENRMEDNSAFNNVHAKTGTLSGVSCLSGYVTSAKGDLISFSILMQNYVGSSRNARYFQDEICRLLSDIEE